MHRDVEQEVVSHPFPPALPLVCAVSVLPFNPCQCASHYKLSLQSFILVFLVSAGISQLLGFERVTDVPQDSDAHVLPRPACQELER